ncbi:hypothetical protein [Microvirga pakistanensis]|uniref:hypothetical protein n=1 Tax=Microvirga pakistanensis TaxID=1682650 RepID=UPI003CC7C4D9
MQYRPAGDRRNPRKYTISEYGQVTPHRARMEDQRVLAERAAGSRVWRNRLDPARSAPDRCVRYGPVGRDPGSFVSC